MTVQGYGRAVTVAGAAAVLLAGALALWLSAAAPSGAASANQQQGTAVTVAQKTISWGSTESCTQSMGTADFGSVLPGATAQSAAFNGCVTSSSAGWSVSASATDLVGPTAASQSIPKGNLRIRTTGSSGSAATVPTSCQLGATPEPLGCSLATTATLISGGTGAGTGGIAYDYALAVPAATAGGAYSGTVTFTASN